MGFRIGLIDSGININDPLIDEKYIIQGWNSDYEHFGDLRNHGTICTYLIQSFAPDVQIYNVKVFDKSLVTSTLNIINAIKWCIENNIKLINLSVSINDVSYYYEFKQICDYAQSRGTIIVASADNIGRVCLPAYLDNVFGVGIANLSNDTDFLYGDVPIQLYLKGNVKDAGFQKSHATSFATARMTGIIAGILNKNSDIDFCELRKFLQKMAVPFDEKKILIKNEAFDFESNTIPIVLGNYFESFFDNIEKAVFLGSASEVSIFSINSNLLNFPLQNCHQLEVESYFSFENLSSFNPINKIPESFLNSFDTWDTLLLGKVPNELYYETIEKVIQKRKKVIALYPSPDIVQTNISVVQLCKNNLEMTIDTLNNIPHNHIVNNQIPVLGIFSLSDKQNTFNIEISIRQELLKMNCQIGQISSHPLSEMFGFDYCSASSQQLPLEFLSAYAKTLIESVNNRNSASDLIIVSLDSAPVPPNFMSSNFFDSYTLPNISLLLGYQPDAIILIINELTEIEYIIRNIYCLKYLFNVDVLCIIFSGLSNQIETSTVNIPNWEQLKEIATKRLDTIKKEVTEKTGIDIYNINDKKQIDSIIDSIIRHFDISQKQLIK